MVTLLPRCPLTFCSLGSKVRKEAVSGEDHSVSGEDYSVSGEDHSVSGEDHSVSGEDQSLIPPTAH